MKNIFNKSGELIEGNISCETGFLTNNSLPNNFPEKYKQWDQLAFDMPVLLSNYQFCDAVNSMELLSAEENVLPEVYLPRAAIILSGFAHAYRFEERLHSDDVSELPESITVPWNVITHRLGRKMMGRTVIDDFLNNWKHKSESSDRDIDNLNLLVPYFGLQAEIIPTLVIPAIEASFAKAIKAIFIIKEGTKTSEDDLVIAGLGNVTDSINSAKKIFKTISPKQDSINYVDPVIWAKTFAMIGKKTHANELSNSGSDTPLFHVMDALIGRVSYTSCMGEQMQRRRLFFPENYQEFIEYIKEIRLKDYIANSNNNSLMQSFEHLLTAYNSFLKVHKYKAFNYMKLAMLSGRTQTNNNMNGTSSCEKLAWNVINDQLSHGIEERINCPMINDASNVTTAVQQENYPNIDQLKGYYYSAIARHNTAGDYWVQIGPAVYDLSDYAVNKHPGGEKIITINAGLDATEDFTRVNHFNSKSIMERLSSYCKGKLIEEAPIGCYIAFKNVLQTIVTAENIINITTNIYDKKGELPYYVKLDVFENLYEGALTHFIKNLALIADDCPLMNSQMREAANINQILYRNSKYLRREIQQIWKDRNNINEKQIEKEITNYLDEGKLSIQDLLRNLKDIFCDLLANIQSSRQQPSNEIIQDVVRSVLENYQLHFDEFSKLSKQINTVKHATIRSHFSNVFAFWSKGNEPPAERSTAQNQDISPRDNDNIWHCNII